MRTYHIARITGAPDWSTVEKAPLDITPWMDDYHPECFGQIVYEEGKGFHVRMSAKEENPRAVFTHPDEPVCRDSCLEFFADFCPEAGKGYINLEANSIGASWLAIGKDRSGRQFLRKMGVEIPTVKSFRDGAYWGWEAFYSLDTIEALYGKRDFAKGDSFRGNMYKCGDLCEVVHYLVWNRVGTESPDYHRPEFFGEFIVD